MKKPSDIEIVLEQLALGRKLHRFNTLALRDACFHSIISRLTHANGLLFNREMIYVFHHNNKVQVMLYWLSKSSQDKAEKLLLSMKKRSGIV